MKEAAEALQLYRSEEGADTLAGKVQILEADIQHNQEKLKTLEGDLEKAGFFSKGKLRKEAERVGLTLELDKHQSEYLKTRLQKRRKADQILEEMKNFERRPDRVQQKIAEKEERLPQLRKRLEQLETAEK